MIEEGKPAPAFELASDQGVPVKLSDLRGRTVVLYFYPKDDTPGCTKEACSFRDFHGAFEERGAVVLGISPDGEQSHVLFKEKYSLPFTLLADTDRKVARGVRRLAGRRQVRPLDLRHRRRGQHREGDVRRRSGPARGGGARRARLSHRFDAVCRYPSGV